MPILLRLRTDDLPNCLRDLSDSQMDYFICYQQSSTKMQHRLESISIGSDRLAPVCKPGRDGNRCRRCNQLSNCFAVSQHSITDVHDRIGYRTR